MFVGDLRRRNSQLAALDWAGDNAYRADTRLMVARLRRRATEGSAVRTLRDLVVESELGPPLHVGHVRISPILKACMQLGEGAGFNVHNGA